jgi:hypothetical protein
LVGGGRKKRAARYNKKKRLARYNNDNEKNPVRRRREGRTLRATAEFSILASSSLSASSWNTWCPPALLSPRAPAPPPEQRVEVHSKD